MSDNEPIIGIDFGSSFSSIAQFSIKDKKSIVFQDTIGEKLISSTVFFETSEQILTGNEANYCNAKENQYKIQNIKRYIGRKYEEIDKEDDLFELLKKEKDNNYKLKLKLKKSEDDNKIIEKEYFIEEICGLILKHLINIAENNLNQTIKYAVISVPANFNIEQKKAIKKTAMIQGINIDLIHEPTAAALAFEFDKDLITEKNILVFDLGAGTLDVTILNYKEDSEHEKNFNIITTNGKNDLGGKNFDFYIFNEIVNNYTNKKKNVNLLINYNNKIKSLQRCERAKKLLNETTSVKIDLSFLLSNNLNNSKLEYELTREKFISINNKLFEECLNVIDKTLEKGNIENNKINEIILIGGGTKIYNIKQIIQNKFPNINILTDIEPQLTVVKGATIQAAINLRKLDQKIKNINCFDRIPMSIGIETSKGDLDIIFRKNSFTNNFAEREYIYNDTTPQTIRLTAFEGENKTAKNNIKIGEYKFNFAPVNNIIKFKLKFFLNDNILSVKKIQENNKDEKEIIINNEYNNLSPEEINEIKNNLNKYKNNKNIFVINSKISNYKNIINSTDNESIKFDNLYKLILTINDLLNSLKNDLNKNQQYKNKYLIYFKDLLILVEQLIKCKSRITDKIKKDIKNIIENVIIVSYRNNMIDDIYEFFDEIKDNEELLNYFEILFIFKGYNTSRNCIKNKRNKEASIILNTMTNSKLFLSTHYSFSCEDLSKTYSEIITDSEKSLKSLKK